MTDTATAILEPAPPADMGTFAEDGTYIPRQIVEDDLGDISIDDAYAATMVVVEDGQIVEGTVVRIDREEVLLDIGFKSEGVIPARELSIRHDVDPGDVVALGEAIEALVITREDKEGRLILSKKRAQYERAWGRIEEQRESNTAVKGMVIGVVKGGLIVDIGLRGFMPASLVELRRVRDLQPYVGSEVEAKIIELDKNRNNVVLSRRAWLEETQREQREAFLDNLRPGEVRSGVVSSVVNFGAFVDLGGMDGLVHVSELSWKHVDHPSAVVSAGDRIDVQVLEVDLDRERISLSLKAWCTSRRCRRTMSSSPSRSSPRARSCGSRSSTSTCSAGASACRSSRPPKAGLLPPNTRSTSATTPTTRKAPTSAPRVRRASRPGRTTSPTTPAPTTPTTRARTPLQARPATRSSPRPTRPDLCPRSH